MQYKKNYVTAVSTYDSDTLHTVYAVLQNLQQLTLK
jgi:hypothetical protein